MIGVIVCAAFAAAIFALTALADERWPDRLSRRGQHLQGKKWQGEWGAVPTYSGSKQHAAAPRVNKPSLVGH
ncbi:MAG TPA: hypothetical protein VNG33_12720 [Polyangiaceae bacterium]|nr:hypothetical protein [Polyangiaceae bacterium]